jgi:hypothetical protein
MTSTSYLETIDHSWYNVVTHCLRSDGSVTRAKLKELVFFPHGIMIRVSMTGRNAHKDVDPTCVAFLQVMWLNVDVVSDDEVTDKEYAPEECTVSLGSLVLAETVLAKLNEDQKAAFRHMTTQVNLILQLQHNQNL